MSEKYVEREKGRKKSREKERKRGRGRKGKGREKRIKKEREKDCNKKSRIKDWIFIDCVQCSQGLGIFVFEDSLLV